MAYALALDSDPDRFVSLVLQRTPNDDPFPAPEERGVAVSHELHPRDEIAIVLRVLAE